MTDMSAFDHDALVAAAEGQIAQESGNTPEPEPQHVPETQATTAEQETPTDTQSESFTDASIDDLEGLPQELIDRFNQQKQNMDKAWTQKTQQLAEQRKQWEALSETGLSPEDAVQAVQFLQRLDSEPEFQAEFINRMTQFRAERGYGDIPTTVDVEEDDDDSDYIPPALAQKLAEYDARFAQQKAREEEMYWANRIHEQEIALRDQYGYKPEDLDAIKKLGYSTQGDLLAANDLYLDIQKRFAQQYLTNKNRSTLAPELPPNTVSEEIPEPAATIKDAGKSALEQLRAIMDS